MVSEVLLKTQTFLDTHITVLLISNISTEVMTVRNGTADVQQIHEYVH